MATKTERIIEYKEANPESKPQEIAEAIGEGTSAAYVSSILSKHKKASGGSTGAKKKPTKKASPKKGGKKITTIQKKDKPVSSPGKYTIAQVKAGLDLLQACDNNSILAKNLIEEVWAEKHGYEVVEM